MILNRLIALTTIFFAVQLGESFIQKGIWPLSTFSMYSESLIKEEQEVIFEMVLSNGEKVYNMPLHELPIDYYKGLILLRKTFYDEKSLYFHKKDTFIKMYLDFNNFNRSTKKINVYSVSVNQVDQDNYHWNHFHPRNSPLYIYVNPNYEK